MYGRMSVCLHTGVAYVYKHVLNKMTNEYYPLDFLENHIYFNGHSLNVFRLYLPDRIQRVSVEGVFK